MGQDDCKRKHGHARHSPAFGPKSRSTALLKRSSSHRTWPCTPTPLTQVGTQRYCCVVVLPEFADDGNLPAGIHWVTWDELTKRFGTTEYRRRLLSGLKRALESLKGAGCETAYVDGSFVTSK